MPKALLDVNVLIAAIISPLGAPAEILDAWRRRSLDLIVSERLLPELSGVLQRPRFRRWISAEEIESLISHFRNHSLCYEDAPTPARIAPDPKDDYLIALARVSHADALVSGDASLRRTSVPEMVILTPREFVDHFLN